MTRLQSSRSDQQLAALTGWLSTQVAANQSNIDPSRCRYHTGKVLANPSDAAAPSVAARSERREKRLHVAVPVKVFLDPNSINSQLCCTYEISMVGARLVALSGVTRVGQVIWLQRNNRRARYKVMWIGEPETPQASQIGVEALEPANVIWENELRMRIMQS
jgi:hypothetical protein